MAMAGARVIKVESPLGEGLQGATGSESFPFTMLNGLKETITINLKSEAGRELVVGLARRADVLLENFRPGTMDKFGVGADALLKENPRLIYAASTGYGSSGPYRDYLAMDITVQAMSGIVSITGNEGEPPLKSGYLGYDRSGREGREKPYIVTNAVRSLCHGVSHAQCRTSSSFAAW